MNSRTVTMVVVASLLAPCFASADFNSSSAQARTQVGSLSTQQLDGLNQKVFTDAFTAARIVGYDRSEIDQLKSDVQELKQENAQLRAQLTLIPAGNDARISSLETRFASLQEML